MNHYFIVLQSVLAAIDGDGELISDTMGLDDYRGKNKQNMQRADDSHISAIFAAPCNLPEEHTLSVEDLDHSQIEGLDPDATIVVVQESESAAPQGDSWRDRVKKQKLLDEISRDKRQQRLEAARAKLGEVGEGAGEVVKSAANHGPAVSALFVFWLLGFFFS